MSAVKVLLYSILYKIIGVLKNPSKAASLYLRAAQAGDIDGMYFYGVCNYEGFGVYRML